MKKLKIFAVAFSLLIAGSSMAQSKIGYIDAETILYLMPETAQIDSLMTEYRNDSIQPEVCKPDS